jgi:hypothetical protein
MEDILSKRPHVRDTLIPTVCLWGKTDGTIKCRHLRPNKRDGCLGILSICA